MTPLLLFTIAWASGILLAHLAFFPLDLAPAAVAGRGGALHRLARRDVGAARGLARAGRVVGRRAALLGATPNRSGAHRVLRRRQPRPGRGRRRRHRAAGAASSPDGSRHQNGAPDAAQRRRGPRARAVDGEGAGLHPRPVWRSDLCVGRGGDAARLRGVLLSRLPRPPGHLRADARRGDC